jgi:NADPH:quinone reductase-like Zn-dependent oxidoreductase
VWNLLPNRRHALFFNLWAGKKLHPDRFRAAMRADLAAVFAALGRGDISAPIAARLPLAQAAEALRLAESGTVAGKIVLTP